MEGCHRAGFKSLNGGRTFNKGGEDNGGWSDGIDAIILHDHVVPVTNFTDAQSFLYQPIIPSSGDLMSPPK
jgi:hypothetical protein